MDRASILALAQNAALLLALAFIFDLSALHWRGGRISRQQVLIGLILGSIGIVVMLTPWVLTPGIIFDTRSVLLGISGLFFGWIPTVIAMAIIASFRLLQGGTAAWTGVSVILTTGTLGIIWRHYRRRPLADIPGRELYLFGIVIHLVMLALMLTLPWNTAMQVLASITLPVMMIYPLATAVLGMLMRNHLQRGETQEKLRESEERFRSNEAGSRRHVEELTVIYDAARKLQRLYTPDALAQELISLLEDTLHYAFSAVLLVDEGSGELIPFAISDQGRGPNFIPQDKSYIASHHMTTGEGITGYVARTGQTLRVGDVRRDSRYHAMRDDIRSELCVPLRAEDRIIGVLNVETPTPDAYTESDQRVLETIASQIALAIQQAQLHEQIRRHAAELEERVRDRTVQLEAANKELEAFAYSVSHDLRAPLRALDGFSDALLAHNARQLDDQGRHYLDRIQQASQRMGQLINDLLNLSRITRAEFTRLPVDLAALARDIATELQTRDPQRQVTFSIAAQLETQGDARLLRVALQNLLENAWKFTDPRSQTRIEVGMIADCRLPIADLDTPRKSEIENLKSPIYFVRDNGVGFDMAYADKLFAPFQRLHGVQEFPGTGIGLVTVRRIITRHGGRIWAEAAMGHGATFYFTLEDR